MARGLLDRETDCNRSIAIAETKLSEMCQELCDKVTEHLSRATVQLIQKVDDRLHRKGSDVQCKLAELDLADSVTVEDVQRVKSRAWSDSPVRYASEGFKPQWSDRMIRSASPKKLLRVIDADWATDSEDHPGSPWSTRVVPAGEGMSDASEVSDVSYAPTDAVKNGTEGPPKAPSVDNPKAPNIGATWSTKKSKTGGGGRAGIAEKIFGLVPDLVEAKRKDGLSGWRRSVKRVLCSTWFECVAMSMIIIHAVQIGIQINYLAETKEAEAGPAWRVVDLIFCSFFTLEVILKLFVYRLRFFCMHGCAWNILDFIVSALQIFEETAALVFAASSNDEPLMSSGVMRTVRVLRGIKVMRLVRTVRHAEELQLIVSCLILSLRTFICVLSLLVMTIYVMAIYATQAVYVHRIENPDSKGNADLTKWWGSIPISMLSVFQALSGGVDWNDISSPLLEYVSPGFGIIFILFMAFCYLALMNVITGTFVEAVSRQAGHIKIRTRILQARRVFNQIDADGSGFISLDEIQNQTATAAVVDFFESIDVDASEAQYLLEVLDADGSGTIAFEEFLHGTLRLNSPSTAADVLLVARELKRFFVHNTAEMQLIKQQLSIM
ncbi:unnamed protein product [Effrenium voratum]|nr:unnamed protein product [Effrenium voratum]